MIEKLKEELNNIRNKALSRPIVVANLLAIIAIGIYKITGMDEIPVPGGTQWAYEQLNKLNIHENDVIELEGRVADIEIREGYGGPCTVLKLESVGMRSDDSNSTMTDSVDIESKKWVKIARNNKSVQIWLKNDSNVLIGNYVVVSGKLDYFDRATNPGQFDACKFYKNRGYLFAVKNAELMYKSESYSKLFQTMRKIRKQLESVIDNIYSREDAAIVKAMLLGNRNSLDYEVKDTFQKNGIAHILAISGLHISFLCMGLYRLLRRSGVNSVLCSSVSALFLALYVIMVGFTASSCRAGIMFAVFLLSKPLKRSYDLLTALSMASLLLLIGEPGYLFDTAFQMSFMAVLSIVYYNVLVRNGIDVSERKRLFLARHGERLKQLLTIAVEWGYGLVESMLVSGVVFVVTLPVVLSCYYEVAWYSVVLNLVVIPLMGVLLVASILAIFLTITVKEMSCFPLYFSKFILWLFKIICVTLEGTGMGRTNEGAPSWWKIVIYYCILLLVCKYGKMLKNTVFITGVTTCLLLVGIRLPHGFNLYMMDVGQGDCLLGINDNGNVYIFDGGSSSVTDVGSRRIIPMLKYMGVNDIEGIFLSHPDEDHINGVAQLLAAARDECISVKNVFIYKGFAQADVFIDMQTNCEDTRFWAIDSEFELCDGNMRVDCIYPVGLVDVVDSNNASLVLRVEYGDFSMLETGDIETDAEQAIIYKEETRLKSRILKVAHHGSKSSSTSEFIEAVEPDLALISVGMNNRYGHPAEKTLDTLAYYGTDVIRTDESGCIHIYSDGRHIKVKCWNE